MFGSDNAGIGFVRRLRRTGSTISRYDLLLATIPLALGSGLLAGAATDLPLEAALAAGTALAALAVLDGLFINPPTGLERT